MYIGELDINTVAQKETLTRTPKLAIVSDQLAGGIGGAESILFSLYDLYPDATTYTTVYNRDIIPDRYKNRDIRASLIQKLPFSDRYYQAYLPLMPFAIEYMNLQEYDLIFSSHHCVAKGIIPRPDAVHICYCHSPARYIWDLFWSYSKQRKYGMFRRLSVFWMLHYLRMWDVTCSDRVDHFLANSSYTAARIKKFYNRESEILFPPVNTSKFRYEGSDDYYLIVGRLVSYKGFELALEAFNESGKNLVIIGEGAEYKRLKAKAMQNVKLLGKVSDQELIKHMNNCKAFIFPGIEDFGIVMAEAQAAGKPVIAINVGGSKDIVINNETGILFDDQTISSLNDAIKKSESIDWNHHYIEEHAKKFDKSVFIKRLKYILENTDLFKRR